MLIEILLMNTLIYQSRFPPRNLPRLRGIFFNKSLQCQLIKSNINFMGRHKSTLDPNRDPIRCCRCKRELPREYFTIDRTNDSRGFLRYSCRACDNYKFRIYYKKKIGLNSPTSYIDNKPRLDPMRDPIECTNCYKSKPRSGFLRVAVKSRGGVSSHCKACRYDGWKICRDKRNYRKFLEESRQNEIQKPKW